MDDLLTTKQVQELLQVDRATIYRMLKDGRLPGIKIGQQWRFPREEVQDFISGAPRSQPEEFQPDALEILPLYCVRNIQEVFAELAEVGVVTTDSSGNPITEISNSCRFCTLIFESKSGRKACISAWLERVADTFERVGYERADLMNRLQRIAAMSALNN